MTMLVTGGCGYIGSHVAWALHDTGRELVILDDLSTGDAANAPPSARLVVGDVGDAELLDHVITLYSVDAVVHLAGKILPAESLERPLDYFWENTAKSMTLLKAMVRRNVKRLVFSSTAAVYGQSSSPKVDEQAPTQPISPYGTSKLMVEQVMSAAGAAHGLKSIALRYFNVAGVDAKLRCGPRGPNPGHLIRTVVDVARGRKAMLQVFGADYDTPDGTCIRDYIHVSDLAAAHIAALSALDGQEGFRILNCGYGRGESVRDVIRASEAVIGRPLPHEIAARRPGDPVALVADPTALLALGSWSIAHDNLETIIESMLAWDMKCES